MPEGTITTTTISPATPEPCDLLTGWIYIIVVGSLVSGCTALAVLSLAGFHENAFGSTLTEMAAFTADAVVQMLLSAWLIGLIVGFIPLTVFYVLVRWAAATIEITMVVRIAVGLVSGLSVNSVILYCVFLSTGGDGRVLSAADLANAPYLEIQAAALAVSLLARIRWFGV